MIPALALLALTGCAGYSFTLPSNCSARYLVEYLTSRLPDNGAFCTPIDDVYYTCRYWTRPTAISCECFEREIPPPGQVWWRVT